MKLDVLIYTTSKAKLIERDLEFARERLLLTKGRESVRFTVKEVSAPNEIPVLRDSDGDERPDWVALKELFPAGAHNAVGFHFLPAERKKWGVKTTLNGSYHRDIDHTLDFWVCAKPRNKAKHYPFSEFARVLLHEILHGDVHWTGANNNLVHHWDYNKRAIHELPAELSYEKWNLWAKVRDLTQHLLVLKSGKLLPPLSPRYFGNVTQRFGAPSSEYKSGIHPGVDFGCPVGTQVSAPCDGEIYEVFSNHPTLGNAVYYRFEHRGQTYYMRFLHLSYAGGKGKYKRGRLIGLTGNTGHSTGPHLHLDIWNRPIDAGLIVTADGVRKYLLDPQTMFP